MIMSAAAVGLAIVAVLLIVAWIWWLSRPAPRRQPSPGESSRPPVLVVVPVFDEAPLIERKLENLAALKYPGTMQILIVDGGSTDGTTQRVRGWIARGAPFELLLTSHRNKTAQLNEALRAQSFGDWILVTDADAELPADTLARLVEVAGADATVGVVGLRVLPGVAHSLESLHWRVTDWLRERESARGSAGIVAAPCYLVRRELLADLPADTIADDVHVACRAMLSGFRVGHARCTVVELRSPRTLSALLRHKFRKADAYLREIVRFAPHVRRFAPSARAVFLWRAVLLTLVPLLGAAACCLAALASVMHAPKPPAVSASLLVLLLLRPVRGAMRIALLAALLGIVSVAALVAQPFSRQTASFPKIITPSDRIS